MMVGIPHITWNLFGTLYFWAKKPSKIRPLSNKNKGHLGSRYVYMCIVAFIICIFIDLKIFSMNEDALIKGMVVPEYIYGTS